MAYFRKNDEETRRQGKIPEETDLPEETEIPEAQDETEDEEEYDDGFDELTEGGEEEQEPLTEEEQEEKRSKRFRLAFGAGNLTAVITGSVVILVLLALLLSMINFVINDVNRSFTLLQTRF